MTEYLTETVFTWGGPQIKFGVGAMDEIGHDMGQLGAERVLIVTDAGVAATGIPERIHHACVEAGLKVDIYDGVHAEPTDDSINAAVSYASEREWDGFLGVGGGSAIDTAKAINLMTTDGGELMEYVNPPIGQGRAPTTALKPLVAVPTTAGTGSESTPVCVLDLLGLKLKTGISHPRLRPTLAIVDPLTTLSLPSTVTAASGVDVLTHALESYTSKPFDARARKTAETRVAYCGANPISDLWCEQALRLLSRSFRKAVLNGQDLAARTDMMLAAMFAGLGFGNAGVHIPHSCAYPIAGRVRSYKPGVGYPDEPQVPHGQSVGVTAPAAFRFTFPAAIDRHIRAAELLGADSANLKTDHLRELLPQAVVDLFRDIGFPTGVAAFGYDSSDVDDLVEGTLAQQRLLVGCPREPSPDDLANILIDSMENF